MVSEVEGDLREELKRQMVERKERVMPMVVDDLLYDVLGKEIQTVAEAQMRFELKFCAFINNNVTMTG